MKCKSLFRITITIVFFICFSNQLFAQKKHITKPKLSIKNSANMQVVSAATKKLIVDTLFETYYKRYIKDSKEYGSDVKVTVTKKNGSRTLNFVNTNKEGFGPETIIPNSIIEGDLNNDSCNDLIVNVYYNQGSRPRLDIYCYITKNKKLQFFEKHSIHSLGICGKINDTTGRFFPEKIEKGQLVGETQCLQAGDPGCCPSLEFITYFKFEDGFKFVRQEPKKRTK